MTPIVLTVIDGREDRTRLVIEDTGTGPEIRLSTDCKIAADRSTAVDVDHAHCQTCRGDKPIHELLDLTSDEADILTRWRTRKEDGVSAAQLGAILDKVVEAINAPDPECSTLSERILLRVESGNG